MQLTKNSENPIDVYGVKCPNIEQSDPNRQIDQVEQNSEKPVTKMFQSVLKLHEPN